MKNINKNIALSGLIGGAYAVLTIALAPISYGPVQVRIAEALTVLPFLFPQSVLGLYFGCMIANIFGGFGPIDIFGGSFITLLAALATYYLRKTGKIWLAPLPPVLFNALGVSLYLHILADLPYWLTSLYIAVGQIVACYFIGIPFLLGIRKKLKDYF